MYVRMDYFWLNKSVYISLKQADLKKVHNEKLLIVVRKPQAKMVYDVT